jgi:uncharacterized protein
VPARTDTFDLGRLSLSPGEARHLDLETTLGDFKFGSETYSADPRDVPVRLDVTRMASGWSLRLRFAGAISGACMRCLEPALQAVEVDAREVDQPGGGEELSSPYVRDEELDVRAWAHDAFALALPGQITCREECAGLCPRCGANLNEDPGHAHEPEVDPRWAKLAELKLEPDD